LRLVDFAVRNAFWGSARDAVRNAALDVACGGFVLLLLEPFLDKGRVAPFEVLVFQLPIGRFLLRACPLRR
jgi:hypothetical protein